MDYEKKYKETLERARKWYNDSHITIGLKGNLKDIFPELAELKDDETLRKNLIKAFNTVGGRHWGGLEVRKILTWLEKQDEIDLEHYKDGENEKRKFVGYGFLKCKGDFLSFKEGETYWLEYIGKDNYNVRSDNLLGQTFHIKPVELYTVFCPTTWLEKQGNEPKVSYTTIVETGNGGINALVTIPFGAKDSELQEASYHIPEGFHAEIEGDKVTIKKGEKPTAWSEEDEHRVKDTIYFLDTAKKHYASVIELDACIDWLKQLKQRIGWKPSKGQLECLSYAIDKVEKDYNPLANNRICLTLKALKEQLEKL